MNEITESLGDIGSLVLSWYQQATLSVWWPIAVWLAGVIVGTAAVIRAWATLRILLLKRNAARSAETQDEDLRLQWFLEHDFLDAARDYLEPFCSNVDPSDRDDLRATVSVREPVFEALDRELDSSDRRYILVLADSGMGKTTLLLNMVAREQRRREGRRRRMALVPLGEAGALEKIEAIANKRDTILLLDALDEDPRAIEDISSRLEKIVSTASTFKAVLLTCRTQFFPSDADLPLRTGIKRVAARRAGEPVVYQWRTVYLQPFDHIQINKFMCRAVPWYRFERRIKANKIVGDISDLAARPMLTALIPSIAASKRKVHGLWDLYVFMVDKWVERESSWIESAALQQISMLIAVDLVMNRTTRGSERISRADLVVLANVQGSAIETWKLTSRSLLNRDADGFYKFAHRSIMEFFFIKALVGGEASCLSVKWTDMMCDLFLSWGTSVESDPSGALELIKKDFRATGLFPIVERHEPSTRLDSTWTKRTLSDRDSVNARAKFPSAWRAAVAHVINHGTLLRTYDLADGLVWQVDVTTSIADRDERAIHQYTQFARSGTDKLGREWVVVDLYELKLLCDILNSRGILGQTIDTRELFWLADSDGTYVAFARIRPSQSGGPVNYRGLELVQSNSSNTAEAYTIDVYRAAARGPAIGQLKALAILAYHGDCAVTYAEDLIAGGTDSWGIARASSAYGHIKRDQSTSKY